MLLIMVYLFSILSKTMKFQQSKLVELFSSLSAKEVKGLHKAVHSPFFNTRDEEIRLLEYLQKAWPDKPEMLEAELVYEYVFDDTQHDMARLRHVMTYLTRIIQRYMTIAGFEEDRAMVDLVYARSLRERNLTKQFLAEYHKAEAYLQQDALLTPDTYFYRLQIHTEYYAHAIASRKARNQELQMLSEDLDMFYAVQKLKQVSNILSYKNLFQLDHQPELMEEVLQLIERKNLRRDPLVAALYHSYLCLAEPEDEAHFARLKAALLNSGQLIERRELKDIYTLAINYCIKRINTGDTRYHQQVFDIYRSGLEYHIFEEEGQLSPFTYKNIASIAIGLKQYEWVLYFLDEYKDRLPARHRDDFYTYCLARYYFSLSDYNQVTDLLQEVEIKEQFTDLDARILLIKTYLELDEYSLLDYSISNLKQQLKRKKLQTYHQEAYGNFAKLVGRLLNLRPYDKKARTSLQQKITNTRVVAEREWLLGKL